MTIMINALIDSLVDQGWYVQDNAVSSELCQSLYGEVLARKEQDDLTRAGIGRGDNLQINHEIRSDLITWFDGSTNAQKAYTAQMNELKNELNRHLFLGLFEYESLFALYPEGAFYKKHLDSFKGRANRMVTTVLYLNPEWKDEWGGHVVIYDEHDDEQVLSRIAPVQGRLVCFMSERFPHEVEVTQRPRASIAGWFRCNASTADVLDPSR